MTEVTASEQHEHAVEKSALPVIDIGALHDGEYGQISRKLGHAARTSGFFYIKNHGIPKDVVDGIFASSKQFHEMPRSYKMKYWCGFSTNHRGYVPFEENGTNFPKKIAFHEAWDMSFEAPKEHPDYLARWRMTGPNVWPDIPGWRKAVSKYYEAVFSLGEKLLNAFAIELGIDPGELRRHVNFPTSQLRLMRYLENEHLATNDLVGISEHSDFECFTILLQGGPGLQIMNAENQWVDAIPLPDTFVVNIGDIFEAWSGGQYKSTQHRVINTGNERYSFPFFFGLDYHSEVRTLKKFRTPETDEKYPPMIAGEHLMRMTVECFRYLADAHAKGVIELPFEVPDENPFKRET